LHFANCSIAKLQKYFATFADNQDQVVSLSSFLQKKPDLPIIGNRLAPGMADMTLRFVRRAAAFSYNRLSPIALAGRPVCLPIVRRSAAYAGTK
jgi:hypothetical protein